MPPPLNPESKPPPEASGRAFLGIIRHIKDQHGETQLQRAINDAPGATRRAFADRILHTSWYPYAAYVGFLTSLTQRFGGGRPEYGRTLGAFAGVRDFNTVFRIYLAIASSERLIRSSSKVWPSYYRNAGVMDAIAWSPEKTVLRIADFPQMAQVHCRLMEGWMIATMQTLGIKVHDDARETRCPSRGDHVHEFSCTWTPKGGS